MRCLILGICSLLVYPQQLLSGAWNMWPWVFHLIGHQMSHNVPVHHACAHSVHMWRNASNENLAVTEYTGVSNCYMNKDQAFECKCSLEAVCIGTTSCCMLTSTSYICPHLYDMKFIIVARLGT